MFKEGYLTKHDYENWQTMTSKYHGIENSSKKTCGDKQNLLGKLSVLLCLGQVISFPHLTQNIR